MGPRGEAHTTRGLVMPVFLRCPVAWCRKTRKGDDGLLPLPQGVSLYEAAGVTLLRFDFLTRGTAAQAFFTTRPGGVSLPPYATLNVGFHVGDDPEAVRENRRRVWAAAGLAAEGVVGAQQVHGRQVHRVSRTDAGCGAKGADTAVPGTDALVTREPGLTLTAYYADCVPILLLDPVSGSGGVAHAGWKGTTLKVPAAAVQEMAEAYGLHPDTCRAVIGPSVGPCCYEVDDRVLSPVRAAFPDACDGLVRPTRPGHAHLDLWEANRLTLVQAGLRPENILVSGLCTSCHTDWFFSHRREAGRTGRMMAILSL